jgi:Kazal-type serine protease inhibitor domain
MHERNNYVVIIVMACVSDCTFSGSSQVADSECPQITQLPSNRRRRREASCICLAVYDPVCDSQGRAYSNDCVARCA